MDETEVWHSIHRQRLAVVVLLEHLRAEHWDRPSLCEGWTVRDVAAHLNQQEINFPAAIRIALGDPLAVPRGIGAITREAARREARRRSSAELIAGIEAMIGSRRHNIGVTCRETMIDILVHGMDIAIPTGQTLVIPQDAAAEAATRTWTAPLAGYPFFARRRFRGYRLEADDITWTAGAGEPIHGPMAALLLLVTGRYTAALHQLSGDGADALRESFNDGDQSVT